MIYYLQKNEDARSRITKAKDEKKEEKELKRILKYADDR